MRDEVNSVRMTDPILGLRKAAKIAGISPNGMRKWCMNYRVGRQIDGKWVIDPDKLKCHMERRSERLRTT